MDTYTIHTVELDPLGSYHADTEGCQQAILAADTPYPSSTPGCWKHLQSPCAGSSSHHRRWPLFMIYQVAEDGLTFAELDQFKRWTSLYERQSGHEPAVSYTERNFPTHGGSTVQPELCSGDFRLPENFAPPLDVWGRVPTCNGKEVFSGDLSNTHKDLAVSTAPSQASETSLTPLNSTFQRPSPRIQEHSPNRSGPLPELLDKCSVAPSQNFSLPDVCLEDIFGPLTSLVYPGMDLSVDLLSSEIRPIGPASVTPISSSTGLVGAPSEQCPSQAYPPRQGTGYVPLRFNGGPMTDVITASAHTWIASPSLNVQMLSSGRSPRSCSNFDESWASCTPGESSTNATPSVDSTGSRRRSSAPNLSAESLRHTTNAECVYDSRMNLVEPRKRRPFSASEREETKTIRAKGACKPCRRSKRRVTMSRLMRNCRAEIGSSVPLNTHHSNVTHVNQVSE